VPAILVGRVVSAIGYAIGHFFGRATFDNAEAAA
jgi:hypothetical protein